MILPYSMHEFESFPNYLVSDSTKMLFVLQRSNERLAYIAMILAAVMRLKRHMGSKVPV